MGSINTKVDERWMKRYQEKFHHVVKFEDDEQFTDSDSKLAPGDADLGIQEVVEILDKKREAHVTTETSENERGKYTKTCYHTILSLGRPCSYEEWVYADGTRSTCTIVVHENEGKFHSSNGGVNWGKYVVTCVMNQEWNTMGICTKIHIHVTKKLGKEVYEQDVIHYGEFVFTTTKEKKPCFRSSEDQTVTRACYGWREEG